jgi:hypothetical protein
MLDVIARIIAETGQVPMDIDGSPEIHREGGTYRAFWLSAPDKQFTIFSNGDWDFSSTELYIEGRTWPPHSRAWIRRLIRRGLLGTYAYAAVMEWKALLS